MSVGLKDCKKMYVGGTEVKKLLRVSDNAVLWQGSTDEYTCIHAKSLNLVVGGVGAVWGFTPAGTQMWKTTIPGTVKAIRSNGKYALAGTDQGAIYLINAISGELVRSRVQNANGSIESITWFKSMWWVSDTYARFIYGYTEVIPASTATAITTTRTTQMSNNDDNYRHHLLLSGSIARYSSSAASATADWTIATYGTLGTSITSNGTIIWVGSSDGTIRYGITNGAPSVIRTAGTAVNNVYLSSGMEGLFFTLSGSNIVYRAASIVNANATSATYTVPNSGAVGIRGLTDLDGSLYAVSATGLGIFTM